MQLYEKALDVFEDDPATSVSCHRHHSHKIACFSISHEHFTHGPFDYHFFPWLQGILHKHLLKSMGTPIVDKVLITLVIFIPCSCTVYTTLAVLLWLQWLLRCSIV